MATERLEVRLDSERRRRLEAIAGMRGEAVSRVVRGLIDAAYEEALRSDRVRAARELALLAVEGVPDPATVSRQLASAHGPNGRDRT